ncbi:MAG: alpha-L-fucosidase [Cyclobacteriaceae bacterium]|nr:alpha-L-fucosidase [Cyclobacteriaceae bacterium]
MKLLIVIIALALVSCSGKPESSSVEADPFALPSKNSQEAGWWRESMETLHERMEWWREARFGMFVHWGVYSGLGSQWQGQILRTGYSEHIQRRLQIPISVYREEVAGTFNPIHFNADEWILLAKEAGMKYFIITSKHHDGFAMWPSIVSDFNIADATPFQRDPMMELRDAAKKHDIKFGFYYSHAFDWGEESGPGNDWDYQNPGGDKTRYDMGDWWNFEEFEWFIPKARQYVDQKAIPQLLELIVRYDPDILWFDTPHKLPPSENFRILKAVREASPRVVINGRLIRDWGDYINTADKPAEIAPQDGDWEAIPTTNESYGWNPFDTTHKPVSHFIELLTKSVARGGNLLMNVGPMGDGQIDPKDIEILKGIGKWWQSNGKSIRGCGRTPLQVQTWGESTRKDYTIYLHVFKWPEDGNLVVGGLLSDVKKAYLLSDKNRNALNVKRISQVDLSIEVPLTAPDPINSVIVLELDGDPIGDLARLLQPVYDEEILHVFDAELIGEGLRFGPGKSNDDHILGFSSQRQSIRWATRLNETTLYDVEISYDAEAEENGTAFEVAFGSKSLKGSVNAGKSQKDYLGRIEIDPDDFIISITPLMTTEKEIMRPRSLTLRTVRSSGGIDN